MPWTIKSEKVVPITRFFNAINPVTSEAHIQVQEDGLISKAINITKTVFVDCYEVMDVTGNLPITLPLDVGKISSVLPKTGDIELKFDGDKVQAKVGKTKYKFDIFAPGVVQEIGRELPTRDLPNMISNVDTKSFHAAINNILTYKSKDTAITKCVVEIRDGILHVHDAEGYVDTEVDGIVTGSDVSVKLSSEYLIEIAAFMKTYLSDKLTVHIKDEESPLLLKYADDDYYYNYLIASMVDVD